MISFSRALLACFVLTTLAGCDQGGSSKAQQQGEPVPSVVTQAATAKEVASVLEYVGRSEASQRVEIRARVTGVLLERPFEEGAVVDAGTLLFRIDPAEFQANLDSAKANVARAQAAVEEAAANLKRYEVLLQKDVTSVAKFDEAKAKDATAKSELLAAEAAMKKAELDLGYTEIKAPIAGRTGRAQADVGNLISPETGVLATIVQLDPINVIFSIGEREYLNYSQTHNREDGPKMTPRVRLANDALYEHPGKFDLIDNEVDAATGTIRIRVSFPNPQGLILPGQFVSVVLTSNEPEKHVVIPQASVQSNQAGPFVLVVDADDRVEARPIKTGQRLETEIVVAEGLDAGETIIVEGIQKVRPGAKVKSVSAAAPGAAKATTAEGQRP